MVKTNDSHSCHHGERARPKGAGPQEGSLTPRAAGLQPTTTWTRCQVLSAGMACQTGPALPAACPCTLLPWDSPTQCHRSEQRGRWKGDCPSERKVTALPSHTCMCFTPPGPTGYRGQHTQGEAAVAPLCFWKLLVSSCPLPARVRMAKVGRQNALHWAACHFHVMTVFGGLVHDPVCTPAWGGGEGPARGRAVCCSGGRASG